MSNRVSLYIRHSIPEPKRLMGESRVKIELI